SLKLRGAGGLISLMRMAAHICVLLLLLQNAVSAGYFPERCCGPECEALAASAPEHSHEAEHHPAETRHDTDGCQTHESCPTSTAQSSTCLCQCEQDLQQVVTLRQQQGSRIPENHAVLSEAAGWHWSVPVMGPHLSVFSACRSHSPPAALSDSLSEFNSLPQSKVRMAANRQVSGRVFSSAPVRCAWRSAVRLQEIIERGSESL